MEKNIIQVSKIQTFSKNEIVYHFQPVNERLLFSSLGSLRFGENARAGAIEICVAYT
jgi:hypothetical protein